MCCSDSPNRVDVPCNVQYKRLNRKVNLPLFLFSICTPRTFFTLHYSQGIPSDCSSLQHLGVRVVSLESPTEQTATHLCLCSLHSLKIHSEPAPCQAQKRLQSCPQKLIERGAICTRQHGPVVTPSCAVKAPTAP